MTQSTNGEEKGPWTAVEIAAMVLLVASVIVGIGLTIFAPV